MKKTVVVRHRVGDINAWLKGHQERQELFAPAIKSFKTFQDINDPNSVILVIKVKDLEKLGAIINDPINQKFKDKHTVIEPITMSMSVDL